MAEPARRLSWIYPDRGTLWLRDLEERNLWTNYRRIAADLGMRMTLNKPEEIAVDATDATRPRVFLEGEPVTPADTIFVTSLYSLPHQVLDVCNQVYLFTILERLGFYLPIPPALSYIGSDKLATVVHLAGSPVPLLPTVRIGSGRDAMNGDYDEALASLGYPVIVKPAYWGMGLGISTVDNVHNLRGVVGLAGGAGTALVVQPYLDLVREFRVYVVDGQAHTVLAGSKEGYSMLVTRALGGRRERAYVDLPAELESAVKHAAARLPTPYFALDFLYDGERYWISEIELDGGVGFSADADQERVADELVAARFRAYQDGHRAWVDGRAA